MLLWFRGRYTDALSAALYPKVFDDFMDFRTKFGDLSWVPTPTFFRSAHIRK